MVPCKAHCPTIDPLENGLSEARTFCQHQIVQYQSLCDLPIFRSADLEAEFNAGRALYR